MTRRVKELHQSNPEAYVEFHPEDAKALGIAHGQKVRLVARRGTLELVASLNMRSVPARGSVFVPFFDESKLINILTLDQHCPLSKEPDYKKCAIRIERESKNEYKKMDFYFLYYSFRYHCLPKED